MLGRAILRQASRISTRGLVTIATTPHKSATSLSTVVGQQQQRRFAHPVPTIYPGFRRLFSDAPAAPVADEAKNGNNEGGKAPPPPAEGDTMKETETRLEGETKANQELERLVKELEIKTKEAKDFKV